MLEQYFTALGWACERNGEDEIVSSFQGSWTQYELRAIWRAEDQVLQFLALPDIRVPGREARRDLRDDRADQRAALARPFRIVVGLRAGPVPPRRPARRGEESGGLSLQQAETLVEAAIEECERFYPVFQFVLWADKTPQEAIAAALIETQGEA